MRAGKAGTPLLPSENTFFFLLNIVLCDFFFLDVLTAGGNFCIVFWELCLFLFFVGLCFLCDAALILAKGSIPLSKSSQRSLVFPPIRQAPFLISSLKLLFHLCPSTSMFLLPICQLTSGNTVVAASDACEDNFNFEVFHLVFLLFFFPSFSLVFLFITDSSFYLNQAAWWAGDGTRSHLCLPVWLTNTHAVKFFSVNCKRHHATKNFTHLVWGKWFLKSKFSKLYEMESGF